MKGIFFGLPTLLGVFEMLLVNGLPPFGKKKLQDDSVWEQESTAEKEKERTCFYILWLIIEDCALLHERKKDGEKL